MRPPNILLITSDQQHWNTIGVLNNEVSTPNLDKLASEGTLFTRAYCPNPTCTPTRASIITGSYPSQHGAWTLGTKLPENAHTVGQDFMNAGYRTSLIGKAHFQPTKSTVEYNSIEACPILQDLDFWRGYKECYYGFEHIELIRNHTNEHIVGQHYALWMEEKGLCNWRDYFLPPTGSMDPSIKHKWPISEEYHYDTWIAERTCETLAQHKKNDDSFFLWASFPDPHPPYLVPEPWDRMYDGKEITIPEVLEGEHEKNPLHFKLTQQECPDFSKYEETGFGCHGFHSHLCDNKELRRNIAVYYGMISLMDKYIGMILSKLKELEMENNTIVIFTTDHGHFFGHHGLTAKGAFHYEDMIKVPFIVRYPGHVPQGCRSNAMISLVDIAPTILSFAKIKIPRSMTGFDQKLVWLGSEEGIRDHIICENHHEPTSVHLKTYVNERYKITVYYNKKHGELFDLEKDPGEINNLWNDPLYNDLKMELLLKYIWAEMGKEEMWMPRISGA